MRKRASFVYRPDSQCCGLRHWPYGQCRFFPFFLVLVAWTNFGFWVNYGQCRFCTTIGPEVANAALPNLSLVAVMSAQLCKRHWPTLHWVWYRNINGIISVVAIRMFKCGDNRKIAPYVHIWFDNSFQFILFKLAPYVQIWFDNWFQFILLKLAP